MNKPDSPQDVSTSIAALAVILILKSLCFVLLFATPKLQFYFHKETHRNHLAPTAINSVQPINLWRNLHANWSSSFAFLFFAMDLNCFWLATKLILKCNILDRAMVGRSRYTTIVRGSLLFLASQTFY